MQTSLMTLTSSQLLNLKTTSIEVIPPQGEGFYITPFIITLRSRYGTAVYGHSTAPLKLFINGNDMFSTPMPATVLGNPYDCYQTFVFSSSQNSNILRISDCENKGVDIKNIGILDLSDGDGELDVQILFEVNNA